METTSTLQKRIEEKAAQKLKKDLLEAAAKELDILYKFPNCGLTIRIGVRELYRSQEIDITNNFTQEIFDKMLPVYISRETDEFLQKIEELDFFSKNQEDELYSSTNHNL